MTTMDLTIRLAPLMFAMVGIFLFAATVIMGEAARNLQQMPLHGSRLGGATVVIATLVMLLSIVVMHEAILLG